MKRLSNGAAASRSNRRRRTRSCFFARSFQARIVMSFFGVKYNLMILLKLLCILSRNRRCSVPPAPAWPLSSAKWPVFVLHFKLNEYKLKAVTDEVGTQGPVRFAL
jgi:hypothetical protein